MPLSELRAVFSDALSLPADVDVSTLTYRSVPQWDSVAHMALVARLERRFDLMLETDEVLDLSSFTRCREILARHGVQFVD
jgi:acyl carrier protein